MNNEESIQRLLAMREQRSTPDTIESLCPDEIFVFGTNPNGEHTSRAARTAVQKFGAIAGESEGLFGQSYAIPVHKHRRALMVDAVERFIDVAKNNPSKKFLVLAIGCGAADMDAAFDDDLYESLKRENPEMAMDAKRAREYFKWDKEHSCNS